MPKTGETACRVLDKLYNARIGYSEQFTPMCPIHMQDGDDSLPSNEPIACMQLANQKCDTDGFRVSTSHWYTVYPAAHIC